MDKEREMFPSFELLRDLTIDFQPELVNSMCDLSVFNQWLQSAKKINSGKQRQILAALNRQMHENACMDISRNY